MISEPIITMRTEVCPEHYDCSVPDKEPSFPEGLESGLSTEPGTCKDNTAETRENGTEFFRWYLNRKWNRRKETREYAKAIEEFVRLRRKYPDALRQVGNEMVERAREAWETEFGKPYPAFWREVDRNWVDRLVDDKD